MHEFNTPHEVRTVLRALHGVHRSRQSENIQLCLVLGVIPLIGVFFFIEGLRQGVGLFSLEGAFFLVFMPLGAVVFLNMIYVFARQRFVVGYGRITFERPWGLGWTLSADAVVRISYAEDRYDARKLTFVTQSGEQRGLMCMHSMRQAVEQTLDLLAEPSAHDAGP